MVLKANLATLRNMPVDISTLPATSAFGLSDLTTDLTRSGTRPLLATATASTGYNIGVAPATATIAPASDSRAYIRNNASLGNVKLSVGFDTAGDPAKAADRQRVNAFMQAHPAYSGAVNSANIASEKEDDANAAIAAEHLTGQAASEAAGTAHEIKQAHRKKPVVLEDDAPETKHDNDNLLKYALAVESADEPAKAEPVAADPLRRHRHGLLKLAAMRGMYRGLKKIGAPHEEPKPLGKAKKDEARLEREKAPGATTERTAELAHDANGAKALAGDATKLGRAGEELKGLENTVHGLGDTALVISKVAKSLWKGSKLLRIGGTVAAGAGAVVGGIVSAPVLLTAAVVVGTVAVGAAGIAYLYKGNQTSALQAGASWLWSGIKTAATAILPIPDAEARAEFAQGHILKGLDGTFGISAGLAAAQTVGRLGAMIEKNPAEFASGLQKTAGLAQTIIANPATRAAVGQAIGAYTVGESTQTPIMTLTMASAADKRIVSQVTGLAPFAKSLRSITQPADAAPVIASGGSGDARRPGLAVHGATPELALN